MFKVSQEASPRTLAQVMLKVMEEVGELAEQVNIMEGYVKKLPNEDGVIGEGVDAIICILDVIKLAYGNTVTESDLIEIVDRKLNKWMGIDRKIE